MSHMGATQKSLESVTVTLLVGKSPTGDGYRLDTKIYLVYKLLMIAVLLPMVDRCGGTVFYATPTLFLRGKLDINPIILNEGHLNKVRHHFADKFSTKTSKNSTFIGDRSHSYPACQ